MREDYVELGSSPAEEDCAQVGSDSYYVRAKKECNIWRSQLRRTFLGMPNTIRLGIKSFNHDFGTYYEVVAFFPEDDEVASEYAWGMQDNLPEKWDDVAKKEMTED